MGVHEQVTHTSQEILAPEIKTLQMDIRRPNGEMDSLKGELISEFLRLDTRPDSLERKLNLAIEICERRPALEAKVH